MKDYAKMYRRESRKVQIANGKLKRIRRLIGLGLPVYVALFAVIHVVRR